VAVSGVLNRLEWLAPRCAATALAGGRTRRSTGWVLPGTPAVPLAPECTAAAAWPGSCAGSYVSGADGSNECPAGSVRIETEVACRTAATAAGKTVPSYFVDTDPAFPRGCSFYGNTAYFNPHAVGAGSSGVQLLCAAPTTGAPPPLPMRARVYTSACANGTARVRRRGCAAMARALSRVRCGGAAGGISGRVHSADCAVRQRRGMGTGSRCMCAE
jgi:hypothetical protein